MQGTAGLSHYHQQVLQALAVTQQFGNNQLEQVDILLRSLTGTCAGDAQQVRKTSLAGGRHVDVTGTANAVESPQMPAAPEWYHSVVTCRGVGRHLQGTPLSVRQQP